MLITVGKGITLPKKLSAVLGDRHLFREALRKVARLSLVKVHAVHNSIEMHPVVQKVTRDRLMQEDKAAVSEYQQAVHALLAASNPGSPEQDVNDSVYDRSLPHLAPTGAIESGDPAVRDLIINQVTRLTARGGHVEAVRLAEPALECWRSTLGPDDIQVLALATQLGIALRLVERGAEARVLSEDTLRRLKANFGEERVTTLICASSYGTNLRDSYRYQEALDHDLELLPVHERVLGTGDHRSLNVLNNVAVDYRRLGDFARAYEYDERAYKGRERLFGPTAVRTLKSLTSMAYDLRGMGRYDESLELTRRVADSFAAHGTRESIDWIDARKRLGVALRKVGYYEEACREAADTYRSYGDYLGEHHRYRLTAGVCLINDYRLIGDLENAHTLGQQVLEELTARSPGHPTTLGALVNYAIVCRLLGQPTTARDLDEKALEGLRGLFGERHPFTLSVFTNLASDLATIGESARACDMGQEALALSREVRGVDHPDTLATAANLSRDLRAADAAAADVLFSETLDHYRTTLGEGHPEARRAAERGRLDIDIEPF